MLHIAVNKRKCVRMEIRFCYTNAVAYGAQLPVRLEPDVEERLERAAVRAGTTKSALIRMLAKTFVDQVVDDDGTVKLPPNWRKLLPAERDGRSEEQSRAEDRPRQQIKKYESVVDTKPDQAHDKPLAGLNSGTASAAARASKKRAAKIAGGAPKSSR